MRRVALQKIAITLFFAPAAEKLLQLCRTLVGQHAGPDLQPVVQTFILNNIVQAPNRPGLRIVASVHQ